MAEQNTGSTKGNVQNLKKQLTSYIERRLELSLLQGSDQFSTFLANIAHELTGLVILFCGVLFLMAALAFYLGEILQSLSLGFIIVTVPMFILGVFFMNRIPRSFTKVTRKLFLREILQAIKMTKNGENKRGDLQTDNKITN